MATRGGIARRRDLLRVDADATRRPTPAEAAWLLLLPALAASLVVIVLLGPPLGRFAFTGTRYLYWTSAARAELHPKPTELARFGLSVCCALAFAAALPVVAARAPRLHAWQTRLAVRIVEVLTIAALIFFFVKQADVDAYDLADPTYFTPATVAVACGLAAAAAIALARPSFVRHLRAAPCSRSWSVACAGAALLATVVWLLPSIFTDSNINLTSGILAGHLEFGFDEAMSVLDGRSPLVNMATYGALVPYIIALPLATFHGSLAAYTTLDALLTGLALLGIYVTLRRLTRSPLAGLALYIPFLATSLFIVRGEAVERFTYGSYPGVFPIRYAGPYALLYLLARQLDGARPRSVIPLFAATGLVVLNNTDFGLPALGATFIALLCARPPRTRAALLELVWRAVAGLASAYVLIALLTLLRAGTLPHLGRLFEYARLFGVSGVGNLPAPLLGFHLVILATFVGAMATAAARAVAGDGEVLLTGVLAWCGVFGLGTGAYFAYRSHPNTLIASFSIWALTLSVLLVPLVGSALRRGSLPLSPSALTLLVGYGLAACSVAQLPLPWLQVERIATSTPVRLLEQPEAIAFVRRFTRPGDTVAILTQIGHRTAYESHVTNVMAYTGVWQMPTVQQLESTVDAIRAAHGRMIFLGEFYWPEVPTALDRAGFRSIAMEPHSGLIAWRDERGP